ncbi:MAG: tripartite tricarboxylate transporter TctB family protein [Burkholderiaceae bacterium]
MTANPPESGARFLQTLVGAGVVLIGLLMVAGGWDISSEAGYSGVGPNFLPMVVAGVLMVCGAWIVWEARTGGFRHMDADADPQPAYWPAFVWVSAGLLINASIITTVGFILGCTLCYLLAVQGMRRANGQASASSPRMWAIDLFTGFCITAPVYWMFTKFLAINLPGLTSTGWI